VYNVTDFLKSHPGGQAILLQFAGKDGTDEFNNAQHSSKAHGMMAKYLCAEMLPHGYDQTGVDAATLQENVIVNSKRVLTAEERKEMKRKQAEVDAQLDDTNMPYHFMNKYFSWFDPVVPAILLPLACVYVLTNYIAEVADATKIAAEGPQLQLPTSSLFLTGLSVSVSMLSGSAILLLLLSNSYVQHTLIPNYGYFWVPASWIGNPSFVMRSILNYILAVSTQVRVHVGAIALLLFWVSACVLLMFTYDSIPNSGLAFLRVAFVWGSLVEFLCEYLFHAVGDSSRPSYFYYFRPIIICKSFMDGFESIKFFGILCLYVSAGLDLYPVVSKCVYSTAENVFSNVEGLNGPSSSLNYISLHLFGAKMASLPQVSSLALLVGCILTCGISRVVYTKCLHAVGEHLSSDSFGAVALTTPLSAGYGYLLLTILRTDLTAVSGLSTVEQASAEVGSGQTSAWYWCRFLLMAVLITLTHSSYSVFAQMTRSSFALHTQLLCVALFLWYFSPDIGGGWWSFLWFAYGMHCKYGILVVVEETMSLIWGMTSCRFGQRFVSPISQHGLQWHQCTGVLVPPQSG
jgi:hypothetical protein